MVPISARCTLAEETAGAMPLESSTVLQVTPKAMPSAPSTSCPNRPAKAKTSRRRIATVFGRLFRLMSSSSHYVVNPTDLSRKVRHIFLLRGSANTLAPHDDAALRDRGPARACRRLRPRDPPGRRPDGRRRRGPRPDGPQRLGQVDPGQRPARQPRVRGHRRPHPLQGRRHHRLGDRRPGQGRHVPRLPVPPGDRRRARSSTSCARRCRPARASTCRCSSCAWRSWSGWSGSTWTRPSPTATSTRASPAARRSATRSCRWPSSSPSSPSSTRPTPASTSTPCKVVAKGVAGGPAGPARARRPGHHPLPAAARPPAARPGAHPRRRAHRRRPAAPSWPSRLESRGLRRMALTDARPRRSTSPPSSKRLPDPRADGQRPPARLPRLGVVVAEADGGARRDGRLLRDHPRQRAPRRLRASPRRPPRRYEGARGTRRPLHRRAVVAARSSSPRTSPRRINLVAYTWGRANLHDGRRRRAHRDGAPRQPRALADAAARSAASSCATCRWPTTARSTSSDLDRAGRRRQARGASRPCRTCSARSPRSAGSPTPPTPPARSSWSTAPSTSPHLPTDVAALGCDFFGFTGHKMLGPTGIGVLWARAELLEAMPAFLGGGEMIRDVRLDGWTPNDIPWKFEAGTPPDRRGHRPGARPSTTSTRSAWTPSAAHEVALTGYALRHARRPLRRRHHDLRPDRPRPAGRRASPSPSRDVHPHDIVPGARPARRVRAGRPPLRQAADAPARRAAPPPGRRCTSTTTPTTSTRWPTRWSPPAPSSPLT